MNSEETAGALDPVPEVRPVGEPDITQAGSRDVNDEPPAESDIGLVLDQMGDLALRLRLAAEGQPLIEQATGLLMAVHGTSAAEAFELLSKVSLEHNMTIAELAGGLAGLAAARGGRSTLNLSLVMKTAVRGVLTHPGPDAATVHSGTA